MNCSDFISDSQLHECRSHGFLPSKATLGNETQGCAWSCKDVAWHCNYWFYYWFNVWAKVTKAKDSYIVTNSLFSIGFIGNVLLFIFLFSPKLSGTMFNFLRIIAFLQICEVIFVFLINYKQRLPFWPIKYMIIAVDIITRLGMSLKLISCTLTVFMTFERFLAVCFTQYYSKISDKKFLISSLCISFLVSLLHLSVYAESGLQCIANNTVCLFVRYSPEEFIYENYTVYALFSLKVLLITFGTSFGVAIALRLRRRGRHVADMMLAEVGIQRDDDFV